MQINNMKKIGENYVFKNFIGQKYLVYLYIGNTILYWFYKQKVFIPVLNSLKNNLFRQESFTNFSIK